MQINTDTILGTHDTGRRTNKTRKQNK